MKDTGVSTISDHLDSFDLYQQNQVEEMRDALGSHFVAPPTVKESPLSAQIDEWVASGHIITQVANGISGGEEAIRTMLQGYKNQGDDDDGVE